MTYTIKSKTTNVTLADSNNQPIEITEELKQGFEDFYSSFESNPLDQIEFVEVER